MPRVLQLFLIICIIVFFAIILNLLTKRRINVKYSLVWLASAFCLLIAAVFPRIVSLICSALGIQVEVNAIFLFTGMFSILILLTLTVIVSHINDRIYRLTQSLALLEKRVREMEGK